MSFYDSKNVYRHLTDDGLVGDGSNWNANVNGVVTPQRFYAGPPANKVWELERMIILIEDNAVFTADNYGGVSTLANGVGVSLNQPHAAGATVTDLMDSEKVTGIASWASHCYDVSLYAFGSGNNFAAIRWTFGKSGSPLILHSNYQDTLVATINDDLSTLVSHSFVIQGIERTL